MSNDQELRKLLREAGKVLMECSHHKYPEPKHPIDNMFGDEPTKWILTDSAIKAKLTVEKIIKYLKEHPSVEEETIKARQESNNYSI